MKKKIHLIITVFLIVFYFGILFIPWKLIHNKVSLYILFSIIIIAVMLNYIIYLKKYMKYHYSRDTKWMITKECIYLVINALLLVICILSIIMTFAIFP